ncbi:hypothetical protein O4328_29185 [Rhodococcus opacus]|uniref:Uncharacterized protein n=1 Tax=Rhodococcus opacus TaxID=37919 RepID=A0AAX3YQG3_RHOOP|nr:hypothetical protein [Rhodococcus opacus]MCZ4587717.1 hypothetical protein [Rhodococcus opacus]WLF51288.1 hypothetical protein Q5707_38655 [Rhodococcus opacus]
MGAFLFAAPATTDTVTDYQINGANIRAAADGHSPSIGRGYIGDGITMICATYGPAVEGT